MDYVAHLSQAIIVAATAHKTQVDKAGQPYILHTIRVMMSTRQAGFDALHQILAITHDIVEDQGYSPQRLAEEIGISNDKAFIDAITAITKKPGEEYEPYLLRVKANPIARVVKFYDIKDNTSPDRVAVLDAARQEKSRSKYSKAMAILFGSTIEALQSGSLKP
jgi:GTP diphosphokinase / guanosine-3',5'-bis(diphosphate) 3'-diphosphatase